ncbi:type II secretory pathway component [Alteromonadaceae bacterium M269]|nr:type II secretory pathway component [Alteromonadaceae bacterium M269]
MLIIAVVVMTVILLLGLALTRVLASSSNAIVYEVFGVRAFNAANAGLEQNLARVFNTPGSVPQNLCDTVTSGDASPPVGSGNTIDSAVSFSNFSSIPGFENCRFVSSCTVQSFTANSVNQNYFRFTSTGECSSDGIVVSRTVAVDARN